ncbi:hypothetical protein D3C76_1247280 [compost metagenome]
MLPKAAHTQPNTEAMQPWMKASFTGWAGKPTSITMPSTPSSNPASPCAVIFSRPQARPMSIENSGMVAMKIAAMAVPIKGVA